MLIKRVVGERGQVVLPKDIREQFGLRAGSEITFDARDDEIVVKPALTPEEFVDEFCRTRKKIKMKDGVKWLKRVLDEQYEEKYGLRRR